LVVAAVAPAFAGAAFAVELPAREPAVDGADRVAAFEGAGRVVVPALFVPDRVADARPAVALLAAVREADRSPAPDLARAAARRALLADSRTLLSEPLRAGMLAVAERRVLEAAAATRASGLWSSGFGSAAFAACSSAPGLSTTAPGPAGLRPAALSPARSRPAALWPAAGAGRGANRPLGPRTAGAAGGAGCASCVPEGEAAANRPPGPRTGGVAGEGEDAVVWSRMDRSPAAARGSAEPFVAFAIT